jgi:O-antigen/teichoic acid export membrane protein
MIHRRTISVARTSIIAAVIGFLANVAFIPRWGIYGAAFASVITYGVFSLLGHLTYRRIENLRLPHRFVAFAVAGGVATTGLVRWLVPETASLPVQIGAGAVAWLAAAAAVILGPARGLLRHDSVVRRAIQAARAKAAG